MARTKTAKKAEKSAPDVGIDQQQEQEQWQDLVPLVAELTGVVEALTERLAAVEQDLAATKRRLNRLERRQRPSPKGEHKAEG